MNDQSKTLKTPNLFESWPNPPPYYAHYFGENKDHEEKLQLEPPILDDNIAQILSNEAYGGALSRARRGGDDTTVTNNTKHSDMDDNDSKRNYKEELHTHLNDIMKNALSFTTFSDPNPVSDEIDHKRLKLNESLVTLHGILEEYRLHEAKELLYNSLLKKLERFHEVESFLIR